MPLSLRTQILIVLIDLAAIVAVGTLVFTVGDWWAL